jgi:protein-tyrosine phosphatase
MNFSEIKSISVICLGNICRSPIGEVVLRDRLAKSGLDISVSSGGTGSWHIGENANPRTIQVLEENDYRINHTAKQVVKNWFEQHDLFLAMDLSNRENLIKIAGKNNQHKVLMYRWFDESLNHLPIDHPDLEVPDPYYGELNDFKNVLSMIELAADGFVKKIKQGL